MKNTEKSKDYSIIIIAIVVIGFIIVTICTSNSQEIADNGAMIISLGVLLLSFFVIKTLNRNKEKQSNEPIPTHATNSTQTQGCLKPILGVFAALFIVGLIMTELTSSFEINYKVGIIYIIAFFVIGGYFIYKSTRD